MKKVFRKLLVFCGVVICLFMMSICSMAATKGYFNVYKTGSGTGDVTTQTVLVNKSKQYRVYCTSSNNAKVKVYSNYNGNYVKLSGGEYDDIINQPEGSGYNSFTATLFEAAAQSSAAGYIQQR